LLKLHSGKAIFVRWVNLIHPKVRNSTVFILPGTRNVQNYKIEYVAIALAFTTSAPKFVKSRAIFARDTFGQLQCQRSVKLPESPWEDRRNRWYEFVRFNLDSLFLRKGWVTLFKLLLFDRDDI